MKKVKMGTPEYATWMCNPKNEHNCEECPENRDFDNWEGKKPCGQQICWVTCHCGNV